MSAARNLSELLTLPTGEPVCSAGVCVVGCSHGAPSPPQVDAAREWIRAHARPRKTLNTTRSSYGLKHSVEASSCGAGLVYLQRDPQGRMWVSKRRYVSNGAFIAAAILEGFLAVRCRWNSPNVYFNMGLPRPRRYP